jgi:hypothetical protein
VDRHRRKARSDRHRRAHKSRNVDFLEILGEVGFRERLDAVTTVTLRGLVTYYVLFFIHLESRRVDIAGITDHPDEPWMKQIARNVTMEG